MPYKVKKNTIVVYLNCSNKIRWVAKMTGICFLTVLESGESKFKVAAPLILRQGCLPGLQIIAFSLCVEENL